MRVTQCSLCGYEFSPDALSCHTSCPLSEGCAIICCPNCGYQAVDTSKSATVEFMERVRRWLTHRHSNTSHYVG